MKLKAHPAVFHAQAIMKNIEQRTGRSLNDWSKTIRAQDLTDSKTIIQFLKSEYNLGRPTGMVIASYALDQKDDFDPDAYLRRVPTIMNEQYTGKKEVLRPLADLLFSKIDGLGSDVVACPCKTYVPFYRHHVFAQVKAATQKRIDVGLALGCYKDTVPDRLKGTGGKEKGDRITHVIAINGPGDIDEELQVWLKQAYELDAE